jgi:hypothetical protein
MNAASLALIGIVGICGSVAESAGKTWFIEGFGPTPGVNGSPG